MAFTGEGAKNVSWRGRVTRLRVRVSVREMERVEGLGETVKSTGREAMVRMYCMK